MTVIAVKKSKSKIEIASDAQVSYGERYKIADDSKQIYENFRKIFEVNGMVVGVAGSVKGANYLNIFCKTHKPKSACEQDILEFLVEFIGWAKTRDDKFNFDNDNNLVIIFEKKIFASIGLCLHEVSEFYAIGSGMFLALGAMYQGADVVDAVAAAKKFDMFCGGETFKKVIKI